MPTWSSRATTGRATTRPCSRGRPGDASPTRAPVRSPRRSSPATTSSRRGTWTIRTSGSRRTAAPEPLLERLPEPRELRHQLGRHRLVGRDRDQSPQVRVAPIALVATGAPGEVLPRLLHLVVGQDSVEVRLHHLFAVGTTTRHLQLTPVVFARFCLSARRPRWSRDMTVPIGMSRICAASAYENS